MPATYEPIASQTLGSDAASVTFSSIAAVWTDLVLVTSTRSDIASGSDHVGIRFNGDTAGNYSSTYVYGTGSGASSGRLTDDVSIPTGRHINSSTEYSTGVAHIMSYANANVFTTVLSSGSTASAITIRYVGLWRNTAAVTSIVLVPISASNFRSGSTFALYGIKAA